MAKGVYYSKLLFVFVFVLILNVTKANSDKGIFNTNFKVDFMSMHTWRGYATSYTPTIEPSFEISTNNSTTGIWAAHSIDGKYSEIDLYFTYTTKNISFTVFDYYCPSSYKYSHEITNYDKYSTKHTIEFNLELQKINNFPLSILVATMVYGDDLDPETNKNRYSTYFQFAYSSVFDKNSVNLVLGFNAFESYYGDQFGLVNAGITATQNLKVFKTKEIPLQAALVTNPLMKTVFIKFGFTL